MVAEDDKSRKKRRNLPPFIPLGECIEVLQDAYKRGGTGHFTKSMLAQYLKMTTKSTSFIRRIAACRQFGLVEGRGDTIVLTPIALSIIAPERPNESSEAKLTAFESIDLFRRLKEKQEGGLRPGDEYMVNELMRTHSLSREEATLWVDSYQRSGDAAGIFSVRQDGTALVLAKPFEIEEPRLPVEDVVQPEKRPQPIDEAIPVREKYAEVETRGERWSIPIPIEGEEVEAYLDLPYKRMTEEQMDRLFESIEALKPYLKLISKKKPSED